MLLFGNCITYHALSFICGGTARRLLPHGSTTVSSEKPVQRKCVCEYARMLTRALLYSCFEKSVCFCLIFAYEGTGSVTLVTVACHRFLWQYLEWETTIKIRSSASPGSSPEQPGAKPWPSRLLSRTGQGRQCRSLDTWRVQWSK